MNKPNYVEYLPLRYGIVVDICIVVCIFKISFFSIGMNMCHFHNNTF